MSAHVVIIGGGIAGLAAMEQLSAEAPALRVTLLEARQRVGGHIRTDREAGFIMEAGPDVFLAAKPAAVALCRKLGIADQIVGTSAAAKGSFVMRRGRLVRVPEGMSGLVPARIAPFVATRLLSPRGKLRVGLEYFLPARNSDEDESMEHFVVRRLGREMYDRLLEPLLSGIFAGDGRTLSIAAAFPQLRDQERRHGGLLRGVLAGRRLREQGGVPDSAPTGLVSLRRGLGDLVQALETLQATPADGSVGRIIRRGARAKRLERSGADEYRIVLTGGESIQANAVIIATPAFEAAALLRGLDATLSAVLGEIEYASTVTISVALRSASVGTLPRGTGYIVPRAEGRSVLACTFSSSKFEERAPADYTLFRFFLGGAGRGDFADRPDDELLRAVRCELREVLGVTAPPELVRITRLPRAMPQYAVGHLGRMARIDSSLGSMPAIALAGAGYRGVGIPDCIRSGAAAADRVLTGLRNANLRIEADPYSTYSPSLDDRASRSICT